MRREDCGHFGDLIIRLIRRLQSGSSSWTWCPRPRWGGTWTWSRARRLTTCATPGQDDHDDDEVVDDGDVDEDEAYIVPGVEVKENAGTVELPVEQKSKDIKKNSFTSHCSCSTCTLFVISQDFDEQISALIVFHPIVSHCIIIPKPDDLPAFGSSQILVLVPGRMYDNQSK